MKIFVAKLGNVECYEDSYEHGEGKRAGEWDFNVKGTYDSAEDLIKAIVKETGLFNFDVKDFVFDEEQSAIITSDLVDENSNVADEKDIELWKKGEKKLYTANLWLWVQCISDKHDMTEDEAELFGFSM